MNDVSDVSSKNENQTGEINSIARRAIGSFESTKQRVVDETRSGIEANAALAEQVQHLTKLLFGSKTEKSKYNMPDGQGSLFEDDSSFTDPELTEEQSQQTISYTVVRKLKMKKRNDSLRDDVAGRNRFTIIQIIPSVTVADIK